MPLSRRELLRAAGLGALGLAAACGREPRPRDDDEVRTLEEVIGGRQQRLQVVSAGTELLPQREERVAFGLFDAAATSTPIAGAVARLWVARARNTEALGPFDAPYHGEGLGDRGVYVARIRFPADGAWQAIVEAQPPGSADFLFGAAEFEVLVRNEMPKSGDPAVKVPTPTVDDARGVDPICTRRPPCSLHRISLDAALATRKPTVLIFATPAYCESRLCGPEVDMVQDVARTFGDRANFIHVEIYKDDDDETIARQLRAPAPEAWKIVEEPAIYYIDAAGLIVERQLGPVDRAEVRDATRALLAQ